jgi:twinkle protein
MAIYLEDNGKHKFQCYSCERGNFVDNDTAHEALKEAPYVNDPAKKRAEMRYKQSVNPNDVKKMELAQGFEYRDIPERSIIKKVAEAYGVATRLDEETGETINHIYPYQDAEGNDVAYKWRSCRDKGFGVKGYQKDAVLFGQHVVGEANSRRYITITEGELDAMSGYQMNGCQYPWVSLKNGAGSVKSVLQNKTVYKYLDSFEKIYVSFDMDENGQKAARELAEVFPEKTLIMDMRPYKDANEFLMNNKEDAFRKAWWDAKPLPPAGIVVSSKLIDSVVEGSVAKDAIPCTWDGVDEKMFGWRKGELTVITAGTGVGKSAVTREIAMDIYQKKPDAKIGMIMLEESNAKTAMGLVGIELNKPLILLDLLKQRPKGRQIKALEGLIVTDAERKAASQRVLGTDRFVIYEDGFTSSNSIDAIVNKVRLMKKVYGCDYIFLDHISIIVSGQEQGDERKALDEIMTRLRKLVEETGIHLFLVSHLKRPQGKGHEEGAATSISELRGTAGIGQLADNILGLERNQQSDDEFIRDTTIVRVLKCRITGITGIGSYLKYNLRQGRILEITEEEYQKHLDKDKKDNEKAFEDAPINKFEADFKGMENLGVTNG